jgi:hypothetical protein
MYKHGIFVIIWKELRALDEESFGVILFITAVSDNIHENCVYFDSMGAAAGGISTLIEEPELLPRDVGVQ